MTSTKGLLILTVVLAGSLSPLQAGINASLSRHLGHPVFAAIANTGIATLVLVLLLLALRVDLPSMTAVSVTPRWTFLGGVIGATLVFCAIIFAPRLGAAGYVCALIVGTMSASLLIDHMGWVGFASHPVNGLRLLGAGLVVSGMLLVNSN